MLYATPIPSLPAMTRHPGGVRLLAALTCGWLTLAARGDTPLATLQSTPLAATANQPATAQESRVKAAYLVKFTQYTTWPATAFESDSSPLVIGIIGTGSMNADLELESRPIAKPRPIQIRQIATPEEAARCHAVFFSRMDSRQEESWLLALRETPVLTVGEADHAIERGAVIRFVAEGKKIRFEVSRPAMEHAGLKINPDMLRYAKAVHNQVPPPL